MARVTSAEASIYAFPQPVDRLAKAVRASCLSLRSLVRERMVRHLGDARQKHAGGLRIATNTEMPCTPEGDSSRASRFTTTGASLNAGWQQHVSDTPRTLPPKLIAFSLTSAATLD